ncbi:DUF2304 domain-containing protein [uncultured Robinsoniella sp.]|uniref:DUF2304 domain-containing protein n=1 Tax=uncultured Robinsoniella sp. TaxID=904190 RepID=UPI00374E5D9B
MSIRSQIIIMIAVAAALIVLACMVKRRTISLRYALPWTLLAIGVTVLTCFPVLTERLTNLLGVSLPVNMIFFMGFCFSLVIIFSLSLAVSRLSKRVKDLAQHQALLERTIQEMQVKEMGSDNMKYKDIKIGEQVNV